MSYYRADLQLVLLKTLLPFEAGRRKLGREHKELLLKTSLEGDKRDLQMNIRSAPELLPFAHYTLILFLILTVSSHVQIALRFATQGALPVVWWSVAELVERKRSLFYQVVR